MAKRDRRVLGQTNTLQEPVVDFNRLRRERLAKVQRQMAARDIGALLLTDIINIRYSTGVSVMPLWTATNLAHYVLVPVEGDPVIFEYTLAQFRVDQFWPGSRPAHFWQARFADQWAANAPTSGPRRSMMCYASGASPMLTSAWTAWTTTASPRCTNRA